MKQLDISMLGWAACRLLLAMQSQQAGESYDDIVRRSGIHEYATYAKARQQLLEHGFIAVYDGKEYPTLYAQESEQRRTEPVATISYPGTITKVTNAAQ